MTLIHQRCLPRVVLAALGVTIVVVGVTVVADPTPAHAALRSAAGGGSSGSGGFGALGSFFDKITTYLIWLAVPAAALGGVVVGGAMAAGNPRAGSWLGRLALGFAIVVSAKGLVA